MTKSEINHIHSTDVVLEETTDVMRQYLNIKKEIDNRLSLFYLKLNYLFLIADCAAASLAIGTLYGEQET